MNCIFRSKTKESSPQSENSYPDVMVSLSNGTKLELVPIRKGKRRHESVLFVEQFVKNVLDFSSQYGSNSSISYTAYNIAGIPSKFPEYGDFPQAFVMRTYGRWWDAAPSKNIDYMPQNNGPIVSQDYIDLEYQIEVYPLRISIYETYNPGSVIAIWAKDDINHWMQLWSGPPQIVPPKPRIFSPPLQLCPFQTKTLRLIFNHSMLDYYTDLDAVLLIGTSKLIIPNVGFQATQSLSGILKEISGVGLNGDDIYNLTPNYTKANVDLNTLKASLSNYCVLYNRATPELRRHYQNLQPIEEAIDSFHKFLHEDFPKLLRDIRDISLSSSISLEPEIHVHKETTNTCGSFSAIPDEMLLKIFKYLDLISLRRCSQVNRHFREIANDSLLYKSLSFKPYWFTLNKSLLKNFISRCQYLQRLDLSWCGNYEEFTPHDFVSFLKKTNANNMTHLKLNSCRFVDDEVIQGIGQHCRALRELCLRNCKAITELGFDALENLEHLERLELYRTLITTDTLSVILKKNRNMKHLNLASLYDRVDMDYILARIATFCVQLESIDLWKSETLTTTGIRSLAKCKNLMEVDFGWCNGVGVLGDSLKVLFHSCSKLEKVFLTSLNGITDRDLEALLSCKNLKQLDLLGARCISREICLRLITELQLHMIDLSFCDGISDSEIARWRKLYPHVSIKRSYQA